MVRQKRVFPESGGLRLAMTSMILVLSCARVDPGPEPNISIERVPPDPEDSEAFVELARATMTVSRLSVRPHEMTALVDAEIAAMERYVQAHGRGRPDLPERRPGEGQEEAEAGRLVVAAEALLGCLPLEVPATSLARVGAKALVAHLGKDGAMLTAPPVSVSGSRNVTAEIRDGLALLAIHEFTEQTEQQLTTVFMQWSSLPTRPQAVVIDLSACEPGPAPAAASLLVNGLAPGKMAFKMVIRKPETGKLEHRLFAGPPGWGETSLSDLPVFVIVSEHTTELAEAVAYALRLHRSATLIGRATQGSGRVTLQLPLPWQAAVQFTVADLFGPDRSSLRDHPVVPDLCATRSGIIRLPATTDEIYREACGEAPSALPKAAILDEVRRLLEPPEEDAPSNGAGVEPGQKPARQKDVSGQRTVKNPRKSMPNTALPPRSDRT